jgi:colanic acid/amylovoran biosynthesis protein
MVEASAEAAQVFTSFPNLVIKPKTLFRKLRRRVQAVLNLKLVTPFASLNEIYDAKTCVEIAGSSFMLSGHSDFFNHLWLAARFRRLAQAKNGYFIVGANFGPYDTAQQIQQYEQFFKAATFTSFRDRYSRELFPAVQNMQYAPDVVLGMDISNYPRIQGKVVISNIGKAAADQEIYERFLVAAIERLTANGEEVVILAFCRLEGDENSAQSIVLQLSDQARLKTEIVVHQDIDESLNIIANASKVIATRFHAMILGWRFAKPTFVISYSQKTTDVIDEFNPDQQYVKLNQLGEFEVEKMLSTGFSAIDENRLKELNQEAEKQFIALDKYFMKKTTSDEASSRSDYER